MVWLGGCGVPPGRAVTRQEGDEVPDPEVPGSGKAACRSGRRRAAVPSLVRGGLPGPPRAAAPGRDPPRRCRAAAALRGTTCPRDARELCRQGKARAGSLAPRFTAAETAWG